MQKNLDGIVLDFPAVTLKIGDKIYQPENEVFDCEDLTIKVGCEKRGDIWYKRVEVVSKRPLPTPDYLEVDRQTLSDPSIERRGYMPTSQKNDPSVEEEEGSGVTPGCGYPIVGKNFFTGLEHPAGFNCVEQQNAEKTTYTLRHHPVWQEDGKLEVVEAVFCVSDDPEQAFKDYIDTIREPLALEPYFAFCSFWSDPYLGNYEYVVSGEGMHKFIDSYEKLGLEPDAYTFDAGWANRKSIFEPKEGLVLEEFPKLSLWLSHNGPMGMDPEYLKSEGYSVGRGRSSAYSGEGYAVLLDRRFEEALAKRFSELATKVSHFKIDWDNECATNDDFKEKYPTRHHVREGSVNAVGRVMKAIRKANPKILVRLGAFWPSPWWLMQGQQIFLVHSGDSEYTTLPTLHQRAAAATHRDTMYYNFFRRDKTYVPLNSLDNHEFPNSIRNVFLDDDNTWMDNLMHACMRGSTYFTWTIQPESLTAFRVKAMKQVMQFARDYKHEFIVKDGVMCGGNPGLGEVYGFKQNNWIMLRNPAPVPQSYTLPDKWQGRAVQFYPAFQQLENEVLLLPEEVKVLVLTDKKLPYSEPFQIRDGKYFFPASKVITPEVSPQIAELHRIAAVKFSKITFDEENGNLLFSLTTPYRCNPLELRLVCRKKCDLRVTASRYGGIRTSGATFSPAVTRIPTGVPGYGETNNPETIYCKEDEFYSIPVPPGGETYYVFFFGKGFKKEDFEIWCCGYEDAGRAGIDFDGTLAGFDKSLPPFHPAGFPIAEKLEF